VYDTHRIKSADLIKLLEQDEWTLQRTKGSHHVFKHPVKPGHVVVPHPKKDLGAGLVRAILKQAGVKE
jgi:predicted RNA binding protein YcfA (HicA-like mRNA interferase family)